MQKYIFNKYNSEYKELFISEKELLLKVLGPNIRIEHIGSTAITDLGGKGIIDIVIGTDKSKIPKIKQKLENSSYEFRETAGTHDRLFFRKDYPYKNTTRRIHLHVTTYDGQDWKEMIHFRDYLRQHPEAVKEYIKMKKRGVEIASGDGEKYRKYKMKFIKNITHKALSK